MEKLATLSHIFFNKDLLDKTNMLRSHTVQTINMESDYYKKNSILFVKKLKQKTFEYIVYRERLYYDLINLDNRIHLIFTDEYRNELYNIFKDFVKKKKYDTLLYKITDILFNCIRSVSITCSQLQSLIAHRESFYNILEDQLYITIETQLNYIVKQYFVLT